MSDPALTIAFQGAPGAYSDLACRTAQPAMTTLPCATFEEALRESELSGTGTATARFYFDYGVAAEQAERRRQLFRSAGFLCL